MSNRSTTEPRLRLLRETRANAILSGQTFSGIAHKLNIHHAHLRWCFTGDRNGPKAQEHRRKAVQIASQHNERK